MEDMAMLFQSETITNHMLFNLSVKDMAIVIQVENFAPLVTVWWNAPLWGYFVLLWTKKEDSGISEDSCCEHLQPSYTLFVSHFPVLSISSM